MSIQVLLFVFRTDYEGNHVNGQGNFGFCSRDCQKTELGQRIKLRDGTSEDAVVFTDDNLAVPDLVFPPS